MPEQNGLLPLRVEDFSGGLTDYPLGGETNCYEIADNVFINDNRDLETRPGKVSVYDSRIDSTFMLNEIHDHGGEILMQVGNVVRVNSGGVSSIRGPDNHPVFCTGDDDMRAAFAYWRGHSVAVSDNFCSPQKIFKNSDSSWTTENLGLPEIIYPLSITLANNLKAAFNAHTADASEHSNADNVNTVSSPDAHDMDSLLALTEELLEAYSAHEEDAEAASSWSYHTGQETGDHSLLSSEAPVILFDAFTKLKDLKAKFNAHDADATAHTTGSLHQSSGVTEVSLSGSGTGNNYIYGLHYTYRYYVEDRQFLERGRVELFEIENIGAPNTNALTVSNIPQLSNGSNENWRVSEIKVSIFRTTNNGSVLYFLGEVDNGTTSFVDEMSDADLVNQETAYTEGGVLDSDLPPRAKFAQIVNDTLVLAHVKIGSQVYGERLYPSKPGEISAFSDQNFVEFEDDITALGRAGTYPIAFLKNRVYRVEGSQDSRGVGVAIKRSVSDKVGCTSPKSVVNTENGVFFAGEDGIYFTDGFKVKLISTDRETAFKALSSRENIRGAFDKTNNRVGFAVQVNELASTNDTIWMAHLEYQTRKGGNPFTTWSGGLDPENFTVSALSYIEGTLYAGDERGYLLKFDPTAKTDSFIDVSALPDDWWTQTIHHTFAWIATDFGDAQSRKWVPKFNLNCDNDTSLNLKLESHNDNSGLFNELKPVENNGVILWGDRSVVWQEEGVLWNYTPIISEWRYFPASATAGLRCMYKQIRLSNNYVLIDSSESVGGATIDQDLKTVTLEAYPDAEWVEDAVNYYISFDVDDYETEYRITDLSAGALTVADSNDELVDGTDVQWRIRGYKKNEILKMMNFVISFRPLTMTQSTYSPEVASS